MTDYTFEKNSQEQEEAPIRFTNRGQILSTKTFQFHPEELLTQLPLADLHQQQLH